MSSRVALGDICEFARGASVPRARMYDEGDYLYIHYGDLYRGFTTRIDVESPQKEIPYILSSEKIRPTQFLHDQDIVCVLTSETIDDLGHTYLLNNPKGKHVVSGTETTILRVKRRGIVIPAYLNYIMQTPRFKTALRQYVKGMKVFRVHPNDLSRIEISLPSVEKQQRVVSMMDAILEKQLVNDRLNDYLAELPRGLLASTIPCFKLS